ncbi:hypothetical protein L1987_21393 [Smallanthus sonchifolius]|uniref:Uncharacterized protein n=1 Tax=Smallanthus sonchifolius TaxID=185202 RepID=A0ACB9IW44_9ASTR|nr:hypothetical protein L1987_21393 [Smallanthus sonchifolius]
MWASNILNHRSSPLSLWLYSTEKKSELGFQEALFERRSTIPISSNNNPLNHCGNLQVTYCCNVCCIRR